MGYMLPIDNFVARNDVHQTVKNDKNPFKVQKSGKIAFNNKHLNLNNKHNKSQLKIHYKGQVPHNNDQALLTGKGLLFNEQV